MGLIFTPISSQEYNADTGWGNYLDTNYTSASPWQPTPNTWTSFTHNKGSVIETHLPLDTGTLFADSKILGREGDSYMVTVEFVARPTTSTATYLRSAINIGGTFGPLADGRIYARPMSFPKGQGQIEPQTFTTGIFTLGAFEANGGELQFNPTAAIDIFTVRVIIFRVSKAR